MVSRPDSHQNPDGSSVCGESGEQTADAVFCPQGHRSPGAADLCGECGARIYATAAVIRWAHYYDGYKRLARGGPQLMEVMRPLRETLARSGEIPDWVGVDLLRGWAFLLVRIDNQQRAGGRSLGTEFVAVVDAIDRHPSAYPRERSPLNRGGSCSAPAGAQEAAS